MEMKIKIDGPGSVYKANQSAITIAKNEGHQNRAKHIDIRYHFLRDLVKAKNVHLEYIETRLQLTTCLGFKINSAIHFTPRGKNSASYQKSMHPIPAFNV